MPSHPDAKIQVCVTETRQEGVRAKVPQGERLSHTGTHAFSSAAGFCRARVSLRIRRWALCRNYTAVCAVEVAQRINRRASLLRRATPGSVVMWFSRVQPVRRVSAVLSSTRGSGLGSGLSVAPAPLLASGVIQSQGQNFVELPPRWTSPGARAILGGTVHVGTISDRHLWTFTCVRSNRGGSPAVPEFSSTHQKSSSSRADFGV